MNAILTGSEYFTLNLDQHIDDYIIRKMIKCCSNLGYSMQATVLCQVIMVPFFFFTQKNIDKNVILGFYIFPSSSKRSIIHWHSKRYRIELHSKVHQIKQSYFQMQWILTWTAYGIQHCLSLLWICWPREENMYANNWRYDFFIIF